MPIVTSYYVIYERAYKCARSLLLQFHLVVRAGRGNDDLIRRDDECAFGGGSAIEHLLYHGLESLNNFALGNILRNALNLIAFQILCIIDGDGNLAAIGGQVFQGRVQKHIANYQLAVRGHILKGDRHHIGLSIGTGGQIPHTALEQLHNILI